MGVSILIGYIPIVIQNSGLLVIEVIEVIDGRLFGLIYEKDIGALVVMIQ